jgi:hypothetical protein
VTWLHVYQESCAGQRVMASSQPCAPFVLQLAAAAFAASRHAQCLFAHATHAGRGGVEPLEPLELDPLEPLEEEPLEPLDDDSPDDSPSEGGESVAVSPLEPAPSVPFPLPLPAPLALPLPEPSSPPVPSPPVVRPVVHPASNGTPTARRARSGRR